MIFLKEVFITSTAAPDSKFQKSKIIELVENIKTNMIYKSGFDPSVAKQRLDVIIS